VGEVTSYSVHSAIISFAMLASIEPNDIADARADKSVIGTWQGWQSFNSGYGVITDCHDGARVWCDRRSAPTFSSPGMCLPCRMQGIPDVIRITMLKGTRQRTIGLVSHAMLFIQDRVDVLSAQILWM
jgi:hypothetical protein